MTSLKFPIGADILIDESALGSEVIEMTGGAKLPKLRTDFFRLATLLAGLLVIVAGIKRTSADPRSPNPL